MSDRNMPNETGSARENAAEPVEGYRGERAQDRATDDPELRREVDTVAGPVEVEDSSGSQHVEAERRAGTAAEARSATPKPQPKLRSSRPDTPLALPPPDTRGRDAQAAGWRIAAGLAAAALAGAAAYAGRRAWKRRR